MPISRLLINKKKKKGRGEFTAISETHVRAVGYSFERNSRRFCINLREGGGVWRRRETHEIRIIARARDFKRPRNEAQAQSHAIARAKCDTRSVFFIVARDASPADRYFATKGA